MKTLLKHQCETKRENIKTTNLYVIGFLGLLVKSYNLFHSKSD